MKLVSVRIIDFRLCKDVTIDLTNNLTVLMGRNGSGKTTLLKAIELFYHATTDHSRPRQNEAFDESSYYLTTLLANIEDDRGTLHTLRLRCYFDKDEDSSRPEFSHYELQTDGQEKWHSYKHDDYAHEVFRIELSKYDNSSHKPSKLYVLMHSVIVFIRNLNLITSTDFLNSGENSTTLQTNRRGYPGRFSPANRQFLSDLYDLKNQFPNDFTKFKSVISRVGYGLADDIDLLDVSVPSSSVKAYRGGRLQTVEEKHDLVVPIFTISGNKLYNNQLSEGTFRSIALIFYIMNHRSKILIIEEPELSVHAELLGDIVELAKDSAKDRQIILSTHSERIINMLDTENIMLINRTSDGIQAKKLNDFLSESKLTSIRKYITEGGNLGDYLFSEF